MATSLALQMAARAWGSAKTSKIEMNADLAESFADILDDIWSQPWLGNATTLQLVEELECRIRMGGSGSYRTVDPA